MIRECATCGCEYDTRERQGKPGRLVDCEDCAEETVDRYTGNMIYTHKTAGEIQINKDPEITKYIKGVTDTYTNESTYDRAIRGGPNKTEGGCITTVKDGNAKGKA